MNQVVNRRLTLKWMWMHPGIQEPRERTKWWRTIPICGLFQQMKGQRRKEERRMCSCPAGTATKGIAHWYYHIQLLLSSSPLYIHALESSMYCCFFRDIARTICDITQHILASTPSIISLVHWNHLWTSHYFRDYSHDFHSQVSGPYMWRLVPVQWWINKQSLGKLWSDSV